MKFLLDNTLYKVVEEGPNDYLKDKKEIVLYKKTNLK